MDAECGRFTRADLAYIRDNFVTLDELCAGREEEPDAVRRLIEMGLLPRASYVLDDGNEMFPEDYFRFIDEAGGPNRLEAAFVARFIAAGGAPSALKQVHDGYMGGVFGICLREVTPETIARKLALVASLRELLMKPRADDAEWRDTLRRQVDELDALEREMAPNYDRRDDVERPPTRDFLIRAARGLYQDIFYGGSDDVSEIASGISTRGR